MRSDLSIRRKIIYITLISSLATLFTLGLALSVFEVIETKSDSVDELTTLALIIGKNSTAALTFRDKKAAQNTLSALVNESDIRSACLYDQNQNIFSTYLSTVETAVCPNIPDPRGSIFQNRTLRVSEPIFLEGEQIGTLQLESNLGALQSRLTLTAFFIFIVLIISALLSYVLSSRFEKIISGPILSLADTARIIAEKKVYSVRAQKTTQDEIAILVDAFNEMLNQIQAQDLSIKSQARLLNSILEQMGDGVIVVDATGKFLIWNRAAYSIFPQGPSHDTMRHWPSEYHLYRPDRLTLFQPGTTPLAKALTGEMTDQAEMYVRRDLPLEDIWLSIAAAPIKDENSNIIAAVSVMRNVTDRKETEETLKRSAQQLKDAVKAREEFLSIAAHELRTPLTPLRLQIQLLAEMFKTEKFDLLPFEKLKDLLVSCNKQIERMTYLVDNLLDVSRLSAGRLTLSPELTDLGELIREVVDRFKRDIELAKSTVTVHAVVSLVARVDRIRIEQVITNLLTNALRYASGKPIEIKLEKSNNAIRITVSDQGIGIAEKDLQRIFERFERATKIHHTGGLGLGLYITKQIVNAHGGTISVHSKQGEGSSFIIDLPFEDPGQPV